MTRRPELQLTARGASAVEIAAIVGALEMARPPVSALSPPADPPSRWLRAGLVEGVDRGPARRLDRADLSRECE